VVLTEAGAGLDGPGDLWLLGAKVTCPNCRKTQPLERAIKR
jgi:hypothetical protein